MLRSSRVLVVEDYEPFRRVLISALAEVSGLEIVGEVSEHRATWLRHTPEANC